MTTPTKQVQPVAKPKPPAAGMGRKKGSINKLTKTIKEAIEVAFEKVGGANYLARMAIDQPVAFMTLLGKVLPTQIDHQSTDGTMTPGPAHFWKIPDDNGES